MNIGSAGGKVAGIVLLVLLQVVLVGILIAALSG